jgi:outer membrane protein OmpA-like peptidoglycan-associated protein
MLHYFKAFSVFLVWAFIALTIHYFITNYSSSLNEENITKNKHLKRSYFITNYKGDTIFNYPNGFKIKKNSATILNKNEFNHLIDSISTYLKSNYNLKLLITGLYSETENNSSNSNLGLLRAHNLKNDILKYVSKYQLKTEGELTNLTFVSDTLNQSVNLKFIHNSQSIIDSIENTIKSKRLYISFKNNKLISNKSLENYAPLLKQYIKNYPTKTIYITGHTDNKGYYQNNVIIGLNRAKMVKEYFKSNGINPIKMIPLSKGESEPIANKDTEEGKLKNRRIEIQIK